MPSVSDAEKARAELLACGILTGLPNDDGNLVERQQQAEKRLETLIESPLSKQLASSKSQDAIVPAFARSELAALTLRCIPMGAVEDEKAPSLEMIKSAVNRCRALCKDASAIGNFHPSSFLQLRTHALSSRCNDLEKLESGEQLLSALRAEESASQKTGELVRQMCQP